MIEITRKARTDFPEASCDWLIIPHAFLFGSPKGPWNWIRPDRRYWRLRALHSVPLCLVALGLDVMCWQPAHLQSLPVSSALRAQWGHLAPKPVHGRVPFGRSVMPWPKVAGRARLYVPEVQVSFPRFLILNICNLDARAYSISCGS